MMRIMTGPMLNVHYPYTANIIQYPSLSHGYIHSRTAKIVLTTCSSV